MESIVSGLEVDLRLRRGESLALELAVTVPPGRTVALLGPNGAGKSTALAAIAGLIPIELGRLALDGSVWDEPQSDVFLPPDRREVGMVFQDYLLFPHLTAGENVAFGLRRRGIARREAARRAHEWLVKVGLGGQAGVRPRALSGGQAQRVALARALATHPRLLLLDEPLAALDVSTRIELRRTLAEHLRSFEGPRILVTHEPVEAFLLADEIHVLEDGKVTQSGSPDDIRLRPRTPYAADLGGANLLSGKAHRGSVLIGGHSLEVAERGLDGPVLVTIRPSAISLHLRRPEGSARNAWLTRIQALETLGDRCRLQLAAPLPLTAEVTRGAVVALDLTVGGEVWVSVKATDIGIDHE